MRKPVRRCVLLWLSALCALTSCGIPATDVIQAGGPASGIVPVANLYFVRSERLVAVPREMTGEFDLSWVMAALMKGPSERESAEGVRSDLPVVDVVLATPAPSDGRPEPAETVATRSFVTVTKSDDRVLLTLAAVMGSGLGKAQLVCTVMAAQRVISPGAKPKPVTLVEPDGRRADDAGQNCPG
ncbi:hypothetical protein [Streptomyces sp. NPDC002588]|uniref:hypothetical protein n=1 Tax=Streptomyces sp. NPDC002588 TaxID=3154419 RepID=UPI00331B4BA4